MPKTKKSKLEEKLSMKEESAWVKTDAKKQKEIFKFCEGYANFINKSKTEREAVIEIIKFVERNGFKSLKKVKSVKPGDRLYAINKNKIVALAIIGKRNLVEGCNIIASHIDSPRLDLKQHPLYEDKDADLALFKTHYYGGIRKYQWVTRPLALHGKIIKGDGKVFDIAIGEKKDEPAFIISDLLPHLSRKVQDKRKLPEGIKGEELNILVGSIPIKDKDVKEKIKIQILDHLNRTYGMIEEDFVSAELEAVPADDARDIGFDRSMIGAYGQDDGACAYTSLIAINEIKIPERTAIALFFDKEEIGSTGNTAVQSRFLELFIDDLMSLFYKDHRYSLVKKTLSNSKAISADVEAALDPTFKEVHEMGNAARMGRGIVITKFTGVGGKYSASDANAEYVGEIRRLFNKNNIPWQTAELGKVDEGGGGTVAKFLAEHNMDVIDCGPALLGMHSPCEIVSKVDIYFSYKAYKTFYSSIF